MGIKNLFKLINSEASQAVTNITFKDLKSCKVGIDTSIIIYQFVVAIRNRGSDLTTKDGRMTSHIHGILSKALGYLEKGMLPVFVFDGKPPALKKYTLDNRKKIRNAASKALENVENEEEKRKLLKKSVVITHTQMNECKEILRSIGVPVIEAPEEADSQLAYLAKNNLVCGVGSEDMDLLTFGTPFLFRNLSLSKKKKMIQIDLQKILKGMDITYDQFIDICILLGCDYSPTIRGIGPKNAFKFIKKFKNIETILEHIKTNNLVKYKVSDKFNYKESREYFKKCVCKEITKKDLRWTKPNIAALQIKLEEYEFSNKKIQKHVNRLKKYYSKFKYDRQKNYDQQEGTTNLQKIFKFKKYKQSDESKSLSFKIDMIRKNSE